MEEGEVEKETRKRGEIRKQEGFNYSRRGITKDQNDGIGVGNEGGREKIKKRKNKGFNS